MGNRRQPRTPAALKVTVSGVDSSGNPFIQTAYARDVSSAGARLDGLALLQSPGQKVDVEHRGKSAKFLVVWVGEPGRGEQGQVGIRSLDPAQNIWKMDLPRSAEDKYRGAPADMPLPQPPVSAQAAAAPATSQTRERRTRPRYRCAEVNVEFCAPGATVGMSGKLTDIGLTGCYIEILVPCLAGTTLELVLRHGESVLRLPARVVTVHPGMGMGLEFDPLTGQRSAVLAALIEALRVKKS
jgi:hypothetical protein